MSDREKLIEMLDRATRVYRLNAWENTDKIADHLIANGVTIAKDTDVPSKWISVEERLPDIVKTEKEGEIVYRKSSRVLCACLQADGKRFVKEGYMEFFNDYPKPNWRIPGTIHSVTHWMPLPQPPREE